MYEGYLELGGGEVLNSARAKGYTSTAPCPVNWLQCPPCDGVRDVLGDDAYTYETIFDAPWYDEQDEATHRFLGAHALTIEGIPDSTREADTSESILDGGVVGRVRRSTRRMRVRAVLSAIGEDALESGFSWLSAALSPGRCGIHADACGAADAQFFAACPPERADITMPETFWNDPITNLAKNPSMETAGAAVAVRTNIVTNPSFEQATAATVEVKRNLATNPSFEGLRDTATVRQNLISRPNMELSYGTLEVRRNLVTDPQIVAGNGWNTGGLTGATVAVNQTLPAGAWAGATKGLKATWVGAGPSSYTLWHGDMAVTAGQKITGSFYVMASWAGRARVTFECRDAGGTTLTYLSGADVAYVVGQAVRVSGTVTPPAGTVNVRIFLDSQGGSNPPGGATLYVSAFLAEKTDLLKPYFDGTTLPDNDGLTSAWTGAVNATPSVLYGQQVSSNANDDLIGYQSGAVGDRHIKIVPKWTTPGWGMVLRDAIPATTGKTYTAMIDVTLNQDMNVNFRLERGTPDPANFAVGVLVAGRHHLTTTYSYTDTGQGQPVIALGLNTVHTGTEVIRVDNVLVTEGIYTGPYFDGSTPAKVRRNMMLNPAFENMNGLPPASFGNGSGTSALVDGTGKDGFKAWTKTFTVQPSSNSGYFDFGGSAGAGGQNYQATIGAGRRYTASVWFRTTHAVTVRYTSVEHAADGTQFLVTGTGVAVPPNTWTRLYYTGISTVNTLGQRATVEQVGGAMPPAGAKWELSQGLIEFDVSTPGDYFDGRTNIAPYIGAWDGGAASAGGSPSYLTDPDFTTVWVGAVNDSSSAQNGQRPYDVDYGGGSPRQVIQSTHWASDRSKSLRIIPQSPGGDSAASPGGDTGAMRLGMQAGKTYTVMAKTRLAGVTNVPTPAQLLVFYKVGAGNYQTFSAIDIPNVAGVYDRRLTFALPAGTTEAFIRLYNGTGEQDVWWDSFALVEGTYVGPYFDGATAPASADLSHAWTGTADKSASIQYATATPEVGANNAADVLSTEWASSGSKSLRIIRLNTGDSFCEMNYPAKPSTTYTAAITTRVAAPWTAVGNNPIVANQSYGGLFEFWGAGTVLSGVQTWRHTFTTPSDTTGLKFILRPQDTVGSSIWYDDIVLVEGAYTGPYFDGSTPAKVRRNLALTPQAAVDPATGWNLSPLWYGGGAWAGTNTFGVPTTVPGTAITTCYRKTFTAVSGGAPQDIAWQFNAWQRIPVTPGETYTVSYWLRVSWDVGTPSEFWIGREDYTAASGGSGVTARGPALVPPVPNVWTRYSSTFTVPAGVTHIAMFHRFYSDNRSAYWPVVGSTIDATGLLVEKVATLGDYFDATVPLAPYASGWDGAANASPSHLTDPDFTYAWTGTAHASTSEQKALPVPGARAANAFSVSASAVVQSSHWHSNRSKSLRIVPLGVGGDTAAVVAGSEGGLSGEGVTLVPGKTYTVSAVIRLDRTLTGASDGEGRALSIMYTDGVIGWPGRLISEPVPNAPGAYLRSLTFTVAPAATWALVRLYNGYAAGNDVWWDDLIIVEGNYGGGPYFDGSFPDSAPEDHEVIDAQVHEYAWTGAADASTSTWRTGTGAAVPDPVAYEAAIEKLVRNLHTVTCVSGPIVEQKLHRGDTWGYIVEFVLVAAVPWMFGVTKPVDLQPSLPIVVQDVPFNLVPYPSAELESGTVIAAKNFATNPSVETVIDGWGTLALDGSGNPMAGAVLSRSTELASAGTASAKVILTAPVAGSNGWILTEQQVDLPGITPTTRYSFNLWASASVESGTAVLGTLDLVTVWYNGATYISETIHVTQPAAGGAMSVKSVLPPAGTTKVLVRSRLKLTSWSAGAKIRVYTDALAVTVP